MAAITIMVIYAALAGNAWISFGFFLAYGVWTLYIVYVNWRFHQVQKEMNESVAVNSGAAYAAMGADRPHQ